MAIPQQMAQDLGNLISNLNPYVNYHGQYTTGEMDIYAGNPVPHVPPQGTVAQIEVEIDSKYSGEWSFKGLPQRIAKAARIRYRFPVLDSSGAVLYYIDDYLLIGFEGANGA